jgi:hypothetical protein
MHKDDSTSFEEQLRQEFQSNPINMRVVLPDGYLGIVRQVQSGASGLSYKVQGVDQNGRFRALPGISCWYSADELRLFYFTASVRDVAA